MDHKVSDWLLEEYRQLTLHYFHEDEAFMGALKVFLTINTAMLAFTVSPYYIEAMPFQKILPVLGCVLCIAWISTLIRIREYREYASKRIKEIESELHSYWTDEPILALDIRTLKNWNSYSPTIRWYNFPVTLIFSLFRNFPSSFSIITIPITFIIYWIVLLLNP